MSPLAMEAALAKARRAAEEAGLSVVYFVAYDGQSQKYCATAGAALSSGADQLRMLRSYCDHQLEQLE